METPSGSRSCCLGLELFPTTVSQGRPASRTPVVLPPTPGERPKLRRHSTRPKPGAARDCDAAECYLRELVIHPNGGPARFSDTPDQRSRQTGDTAEL